MRTHCLTAGITLTALLFTGTAFSADPRLLNLVMPDATTMAGANVTNAEITPFGQYVLAQMTASMDQQLQTFVTATGFDPRKDVSEILAASAAGQTAGSATTPGGLLLALGNFPVSQITAAITAKAPDLAIQTYGGATLVASTNPKSGFSIAFLGSSIAVAGDMASVKGAIDRSAGVNSVNPALATQVQALSTNEDAWAVTNSSASALIPGLTTAPAATGTGTTPSPAAGISQMLSGIVGSSGGVKFGTTVVFTGQAIAKDAATATSLANILQALASIMSMAGGQDPQVTAMAQVLQGLKVTADGATINVALSIPETQLETVLNGLKNPAPKPAAKPAVRPARSPSADPGSRGAVASKGN